MESSAVPTGPQGVVAPNHQGRVVVHATRVPENAVQLGIVEAHGNIVDIEQVMPEFANRVAKLGGNYGKVDDITTKFEVRSEARSYTYSCGDYKSPRTCTGTRMQTVEYATTTILGRAYLVKADR